MTRSQQDDTEIVSFNKSSSVNWGMIYIKLATGNFRYLLGLIERVIQTELEIRGYKQHPEHKNLNHPKRPQERLENGSMPTYTEPLYSDKYLEF